jgi:hypothetical protein
MLIKCEFVLNLRGGKLGFQDYRITEKIPGLPFE